ncbi:MAG: metal ABC transporter ATP-binding protein [Alphaproteobacteria bacterium]|nr:MAG: metal ABC transporter ATP-binding protein [Alphaproteobacteria bacterium]
MSAAVQPGGTAPAAARVSAPLIRLSGAGVEIGGREVLSGIDLDLHPGEILTLVGPNGSGKTTLLRLIVGALAPTRGTVRRRPGLRIGYVPQKLDLGGGIPLSARRFVELAPGLRRGDPRARAALEEVGALALAERPLAALSGGQRQRVLLARALAVRPQLLVLDEPEQGLDQPATAALYALLERIRERDGVAIVMASHELHVVMSASDRVICLNGHICCQGTPERVASAPEYRALFGTGTAGTLALYRHHHDHHHDAPPPAPGGEER